MFLISNDWLFWSASHTSIVRIGFTRIKFVGAISNKLTNDLFGTNVYKTVKSCWQSLLTTLQWTKTTSVISRCGTFPLFLSIAVLFLVLPSNFIVSGVKISK